MDIFPAGKAFFPDGWRLSVKGIAVQSMQFPVILPV